MYSPSFSGFPDMTTRLTLHIARRLPGAGSLSGFSYTLTLIFLKSKLFSCLNARRKTQKVFSLGRYQANFFLGTCVLEKYLKGAENGRKVELKLLTQGHHEGQLV